jgi:peptidoglycan-N-acetylglucosamine deacetylase
MQNLRIVTTSWDDGDPDDLRIAELLRLREIRGTFYVPLTGYLGRPTLSPPDIQSLFSEGFEVGGHGVSHCTLQGLSDADLIREVGDCKGRLEEMLGGTVSMFCYPNGRYDSRVLRQVKTAGYEGARTTRMLSSRTHFLPFEMPTTLQAYPHPRLNYVKNLTRGANLRGLCSYATSLHRFPDWVQLARVLFDRMLQEGGIWHLYGHSWEIEELGLWDQLQGILDYISRREGVVYATNSQALRLLHAS